MKDVVILTGSELRHDFVRMAIALGDSVNVLKTYCEGLSGTTLDRVRKEGDEVKIRHLEARARSESDFFESFVTLAPDRSEPVSIDRGAVNSKEVYDEILSLDPDLLISYGCSIVDDPLLSSFSNRFVNVHLGLSPYYRGTGTNFWPLVNGEPEYVGATFMYIDEGVDTGEIIHQIRARIFPRDSPHQIGNRLIADMANEYISLIRHFDELEEVSQPAEPEGGGRYYTKDDYSTESTLKLYENFENGLVERYLEELEQRTDEVPIVTNPVLEDK